MLMFVYQFCDLPFSIHILWKGAVSLCEPASNFFQNFTCARIQKLNAIYRDENL